jgi:hypothetical protein
MYARDTIMSISERAMSGRQHSKQIEVSSSPLSYTLALPTVQTMMNEIFQDLITEGVVSVYLNDILIFASSIEEHQYITQLVLD